MLEYVIDILLTNLSMVLLKRNEAKILISFILLQIRNMPAYTLQFPWRLVDILKVMKEQQNISLEATLSESEYATFLLFRVTSFQSMHSTALVHNFVIPYASYCLVIYFCYLYHLTSFIHKWHILK